MSARQKKWAWYVVTALVFGGLAGALTFALTNTYPAHLLSPDIGEPLVLLDRHGEPIRQIEAERRSGRESWVSLKDIDSYAVLTLLASEDRRFFEHQGMDLIAVIRSLYLNLKAGEVRFGGSTITMQLMRQVHSRGLERSIPNKLKETMLAIWLENTLSKQEILEQYLNRVDFGRGAVGIEAAARRYFGKPAARLSAGEATYLMVLPRGPSFYDPIRHPRRVQERREHLLALLVAQGRMSAAQARSAMAEKVEPELHDLPFKAPHFTDWVLAELPSHVKAAGGKVRTTLDLRLQEALQHRTAEHVAALEKQGVEQAGAVVLDTETGDVLAMVGSAGYHSESQLNIAIRRRFPGSALKPFVYAAAIETLGHSPATIAYDIADVPSDYRVHAESEKERGPIRYREALAGSYNLAAVHTLEKVGVAEVAERLRRAGVGALTETPEEYGPRLALGSAKVRLVDLAAGYRFTVKGGKVVPPRALLDAALSTGEKWRAPRPEETAVFTEETSWLVMDMLSDPEARRPMFGQELPADLPYPVVVKTGTARGFADLVAVFATKEYITAAWTGRFDGGPTKGLFAMKAAAPLARAALQLASRGKDLTLPEKPKSIVAATVCPLSGKRPSNACPHQKRDYFLIGNLPEKTCDWHAVENGRVTVNYPPEIKAYARRNAQKTGRWAYRDVDAD